MTSTLILRTDVCTLTSPVMRYTDTPCQAGMPPLARIEYRDLLPDMQLLS
jgi:hypothetical protein